MKSNNTLFNPKIELETPLVDSRTFDHLTTNAKIRAQNVRDKFRKKKFGPHFIQLPLLVVRKDIDTFKNL